MTDLLTKHPGLVFSKFAVSPSNQPGVGLFATLEFGEAVIRLPHRTIRLGIDAIYVRFTGQDCEIPDDSREFKVQIPKGVTLKRTDAAATEIETQTSNSLTIGGDTDSTNTTLSARRGKANRRKSTKSRSDEVSTESSTIVSTLDGSAIVWAIQVPPGVDVLKGTLLSTEVVMRVVRTGSSPELRISGEIPNGSVCVIDHNLRLAHKNKCGLTRLIFSLNYCGKPFEITTISNGDLANA